MGYYILEMLRVWRIQPRDSQLCWQSRANRYPFLLQSMKRYLPFLIVGVVALITFGSGFALDRSTKTAAPTAGEGAAAGLHVRGAKSASVTLEEFGDFQCPPCGLMAPVLEKEEAEYAKNLRVVFHHFPLAMHAHAREAALAAEAAHSQGRFWEMHDLIYKEQAAWSKAENVPALFE